MKLESFITEEQQILESTTVDDNELGHFPTFEISELFHRTFEYAGLLGAWHMLLS